MDSFDNPTSAAYFNEVLPKLFHNLAEKYSFNGPEFAQATFENLIFYQKENNTISFYYDPWTFPFVELFRPQRKLENRFIPIIRTEGNYDYLRQYQEHLQKWQYKDPRKLASYDPSRLRNEFEAYVAECLLALETQQKPFLEGGEAVAEYCVR